MGNKLREIGKTGIMIKEGYKRGDPAFDKVLSDILSGKLKAQLEEKDKKKKKKNKKTKNLKIKKSKTT